MSDTQSHETSQPEARVMLFEKDGTDRFGVLRGVWDALPWGIGSDSCYAVTLQSGQILHVWLEGITEHTPENEPPYFTFEQGQASDATTRVDHPTLRAKPPTVGDAEVGEVCTILARIVETDEEGQRVLVEFATGTRRWVSTTGDSILGLPADTPSAH